MEQITKLVIIAVGFCVGVGLRDHKRLITVFADVVFKWLLPYVIIVEVSSHSLQNWWFMAFGSGFVLILYGIARLIRWDRHKAALLSTAEGGTLGFVLYAAIGTAPLSAFFLIDMLGNGFVLFSLIYWLIGDKFKLLDFIRNRLVIGMCIGVALNLLGLRVLDVEILASLEPTLLIILAGLICTVVGSKMRFSTSKEIFFSGYYLGFWVIRIIGVALCLLLQAPLALTVLFVLPPSFLLPIVYQEGLQKKEEAYASNFIAACLPVTLICAILLYIISA